MLKKIGSHISGLVFDCDGTIADTMPLHYQAWVAAMQERGLEFAESVFYELAGVPTVRIVHILNERYGYNLPAQELADRKETLYAQLLPGVQGIGPVLEVISAYTGKLPMAVATGGTRAICTRTLELLGLVQHFKAIVSADDVIHGKPAPDIFLEAARRIAVDPGLCVAFEDGDLGIQAARAAGMDVIDIREHTE